MRIIALAVFLAFSVSVSAQKYFTKVGEISFFSDAPLEKIEAHNSKATSVIDTETGAMQWSILIKAFKFEKALMEEHFNENYMESSDFPKSIFKGSITNMKEIDLSREGEYTAQIEGSLEIHGVKKQIQSVGTFTVNKEGVSAVSEFEVAVADYGIEIPSVVAENIAKTVLIKIKANYLALEK